MLRSGGWISLPSRRQQLLNHLLKKLSYQARNSISINKMEIPINASLGNKGDGADVGPIPEVGGGGFGSRPDAAYREVLDNLLSQVAGKSDYDNAYSAFTMAARSHVQMGMPVNLMFEYQDKLAALYAKRHEPVAPVQHIQQQNHIANNGGPLQGNITKQDLRFDPNPNPDTDPKLLE